MSVNGTLVEAKMCTWTLKSTHFTFNKCPIYTTEGPSAKFSTNYTKRTAKTQYRKFETNIPRKGTVRLQSQSYIHVSVSDLYTVCRIGEDDCRCLLGDVPLLCCCHAHFRIHLRFQGRFLNIRHEVRKYR